MLCHSVLSTVAWASAILPLEYVTLQSKEAAVSAGNGECAWWVGLTHSIVYFPCYDLLCFLLLLDLGRRLLQACRNEEWIKVKRLIAEGE